MEQAWKALPSSSGSRTAATGQGSFSTRTCPRSTGSPGPLCISPGARRGASSSTRRPPRACRWSSDGVSAPPVNSSRTPRTDFSSTRTMWTRWPPSCGVSPRCRRWHRWRWVNDRAASCRRSVRTGSARRSLDLLDTGEGALTCGSCTSCAGWPMRLVRPTWSGACRSTGPARPYGQRCLRGQARRSARAAGPGARDGAAFARGCDATASASRWSSRAGSPRWCARPTSCTRT